MNSAEQDLVAEALFVSDVQPSECLTPQAIEQSITAMLLCHGSEGCAADVATEFGDHPEAAARRMVWALRELTCLTSAW
jgi:hypothetical protein